MRLPDYDEVHFESPPLRLVIAQLRFPVEEGGHRDSAWAAFGHQLAGVYPHHVVEEEAQFGMPGDPQARPPAPREKVHRFVDPSQNWSVVLGDGSLTLEAQTLAYSGSKELLTRFESVLKAGQEHLNIRQRHRLGLRYINEIRHPNLSTLSSCTQHQLLREEFVGFAAKLSDSVEHTVQEVHFKLPDGVFVVRHGLLRGDSMTALQPPSAGLSSPAPYYLLDLDYWDDQIVAFDPEKTGVQLKNFTGLIYRFFRYTLGDQLLKDMKPGKAVGDGS